MSRRSDHSRRSDRSRRSDKSRRSDRSRGLERDDSYDRHRDRRGDQSKDRRDKTRSRDRKDVPQGEVTAITRTIVGRRIKESKKEYMKVFEEESGNHPEHLINDTKLMNILKILEIDLQLKDRERLSLEIDTQKIRDSLNNFSYLDFLVKAGVIDGKAKYIARQRDKSKENAPKLTTLEIKSAEETIREVKREAEYLRKDLHTIFDIRIEDREVLFKNIKAGLEDHLGQFGFRLNNDKEKMIALSNYLCGIGKDSVSVKIFDDLFEYKPYDENSASFFTQERFDGDQALGPRDDLNSERKLDTIKSDHRPRDKYDDYDRRKDTRSKYDRDRDTKTKYDKYGKPTTTPPFYDRKGRRLDTNEDSRYGDRKDRRLDDSRSDRNKDDSYYDRQRDRDRDRERDAGHSKKGGIYSDDEEDFKEKPDFKNYQRNSLKIDDEGVRNMAVNDLLQDLISKEVDFDKTFGNKTGYIPDEEFEKLLKSVHFEGTIEKTEQLKEAFRDGKVKDKVSIPTMKRRFNTLDPSYLNKKAVKSNVDAKQRLSSLPDHIREGLLMIEDYLVRQRIDVNDCFKKMDRAQDGTVTKEAFAQVLLREYKIRNFNLERLTEIYKALDMNGDNSVTLGEFKFYIEGAKKSAEERKRQMSLDVIEQLKCEADKLFDEFDNRGKGYIVEEDLYKMLKSAGIYIDRSQCKDIIKGHDLDGDGKLSRMEFQKVMLDKMQTEIIENEDAIHDLNSMFFNADLNKDGFLTIDELDIMFKQYNTNITYDEIVALMAEIDVDTDGRLDIDEFIALMTMDESSFKDKKSSNVMMKMKKSRKVSAASFAKYFKIMPNCFIDSFTTRLWNK